MSSPWTQPDTTTRPIAIIGGGVLGRRLAMMWSSTGRHVIVCEKVPAVAKAALEYVRDNVNRQAEKMGAQPGLVTTTEHLEEAVKDAWLVIEAVPEVLDIKIPLFYDLDRLTRDDCILATNSSSYKSREVIPRVTKTYRVCNGHYYLPPDQNHLELMTCGSTDPAIFPFLAEQAKSVGFIPIQAKVECTGFIFNRIWAAIKRESLMVMAEGVAAPEDIDSLFRSNFHSEFAPCEMMDRVGLDTVYNIEAHYVAERGLPTLPLDWLKKEYLEKHHLGCKSGKGFLVGK